MMKLDMNAPPIEYLKTRLSYDKGTGDFTILKSAGRRKAGDKAGYEDSLGYWKVFVDGKWILSHRLAWAFTYGKWPALEIDHINGDPSDNRIENLREATRSQNVMNTRRGNGVCWHKRNCKWQVLIKANGKSHYIGLFEDREEADEAAQKAILRLHGKFANVEPPKRAIQEGFDL